MSLDSPFASNLESLVECRVLSHGRAAYQISFAVAHCALAGTACRVQQCEGGMYLLPVVWEDIYVTHPDQKHACFLDALPPDSLCSIEHCEPSRRGHGLTNRQCALSYFHGGDWRANKRMTTNYVAASGVGRNCRPVRAFEDVQANKTNLSFGRLDVGRS